MSTGYEPSSKKVCIDSPKSVHDGVKAQNSSNIVEAVENPINFRDLIFSVTGTLPQSFDSNARSTDCGLVGSGAAIACNDEPKRKIPDFRKFNEKNKVDVKGSISFIADMVENKSDDTTVLSEADVGITEFISQHEGFSGILKQRYSDFVVNEINQNGEVVHLTEIEPPPIKETLDAAGEEPALKDFLSEEQLNQIHKIAESKSEADEVSVAISCKTARGKLHHLIKSSFPDLDCNTIEKDGEKFVVVKYLLHKGVERRSRIPNCFSKAAGNYCKFVLCKENCDTQQAISMIAKYLRIHPSSFGYAGTKDRRAKTSQEVTVHRITPQRLHQVSRGLRNMMLGNYSICKEPLKLGDLQGNRFVVVLRNVTGSDEQIESGMKSLCDVGFINYYGMQRFGTTRISTHSIGQALLQGAWSEAIELIMKPREGDRYEMMDARMVWQETHDAQKALDALRGFHCNERQLLEGLKRSTANDLVGALSFIPRNMRLMYTHAYQSYVWNRVVSRRIREMGLVPQPGDLVFEGKLDEPTNAPNDDSHEPSARIEPVLVTKDNVTKYSISDVVLPLPGYDVRYPDNESGAWYKELLTADGMKDLDFRNKIKDYSLPGSYRKIVLKPDNVSWEIIPYDNYHVSLVESDFDRVLCRDTSACAAEPAGDGKYRALKIELSLPASSYATMAVREVLKCGTSAAYQTTLNTT